MRAPKPVGTILYKSFGTSGTMFDLFVKTRNGWVCIDQHGVQPGVEPVGEGYTEYHGGAAPKVSGAA